MLLLIKIFLNFNFITISVDKLLIKLYKALIAVYLHMDRQVQEKLIPYLVLYKIFYKMFIQKQEEFYQDFCKI
jgi:hypothetical protein